MPDLSPLTLYGDYRFTAIVNVTRGTGPFFFSAPKGNAKPGELVAIMQGFDVELRSDPYAKPT